VLDSDTGAAFRARGVFVDTPGALGKLLRENPAEVKRHYQAEISSRVNVLSALTADTTPRALAEVGMEHRAALITGLAVDLALEAAAASPKPVAVAGVLGSEMVSPLAPDRHHQELCDHAQRLAAAGCELLIARGQGSRLGLMAAVVAGARTELPTWAVVECRPNGELVIGGVASQLIAPLEDAGASVILFEVVSVDHAIHHLRESQSVGLERAVAGVLLAAGGFSVRGFPDAGDAEAQPDLWAERAIELDRAGARVIGGGAGTTEAHTAELAIALGFLHPSLPASHIH
jgi:5-methyltetrahydrofolate--homocysteine methyltransferase